MSTAWYTRVEKEGGPWAALRLVQQTVTNWWLEGNDRETARVQTFADLDLL
jgi:hypothetical protein